jgi:hypothetical protein
VQCRRRALASGLAGGLALLTVACGDDPAAEARRPISLLDNGDFALRVMSSEAAPEQRLAWWRSSGGELASSADPTHVLVLQPGQIASQPFAAFAPDVRDMIVRGTVEGSGVVTIVEGNGARARFEVDSRAFTITGADLARTLGREPVPRFVLELATGPGASSSRWHDLSVEVVFPAPSMESLRSEVRARLAEIVDTWLERGVVREGPRATGFAPHLFDAITGARLRSYPCGIHPLFESLLSLPASEVRPSWRTALSSYVTSVLELGLNPSTGLPRMWDAERDVPLDDLSIEIASMTRFLLDAADHGPMELRERCERAALAIGNSVLAHGVMPDGAIAPIYRPRDGEPSTAAQPLRRLDLPAELCRLSARVHDERFALAARHAVDAFAYLHYWPGELERIDPGFDDDFGHYGARAVAMTRALPEQPVFRALAMSGFERYAPLWREAARAGASMAADQVRCWDLLIELSEVEKTVADALPTLLDDALRAQLKSEQYGDGSWGDVTYWRFDPKSSGLEVGDLPGLPANLLRGIALVHGRTSRFTRDDTRALFAGVLRSSVTRYGRKYGYLSTLNERDGVNDAYASMRLLPALVEMLKALDR